MKRFMMVTFVMLTLVACGDRTRGMEIKTFELSRLSPDEAMTLLTPYISEGGYISGKNKLISVREKPERMKVIDDLLKKYDGIGETVDLVLNFRVIEANGFTQVDSAIVDVEPTLRSMFRYRGYKLIGETQVRSREDASFAQTVPEFRIAGDVQRVRTVGNERRLPLEIQLEVPGQQNRGSKVQLGSTVTATVGKPLVLGQSTGSGAYILVVRASIAQ
jgi:hypothetical protein